jgi:hypothetical protein
MPGPRPSWQAEPCPPWCDREHDESDIALDRYHQGEPHTISVLASTTPEEPRQDTFSPADLVIRTGRYIDESADWIAIDSTQTRMILTVDSALRLAERLTEHLV